MKYAFYCFKYDIMLLKINFGFILLFQLLKYLLVRQDIHSLFEFLSGSSVQNAINDTFMSSIQDKMAYAFETNAIEATQVDKVKMIEPFLVSKSTILNVTQMVKFNLGGQIVKQAFFYNLNLSCVLINMIMMSFQLIQLYSASGKLVFIIKNHLEKIHHFIFFFFKWPRKLEIQTRVFSYLI